MGLFRMDQPQRQIDCPNIDARKTGVRFEAIRALVTVRALLISSLIINLISNLGIVEIPRAAGAAT